MDENTDRYYQALNLEPTASPEEIYQAYRDLARVWDPQRFAHSPRLELMAEAKLTEIIEAYRALMPAGSPDETPAPAAMARKSIPVSAPEPEAAPPLPPDPFAAPDPRSFAPAPDARPIADLYRAHGAPVDLPLPPPRPSVFNAAETVPEPPPLPLTATAQQQPLPPEPVAAPAPAVNGTTPRAETPAPAEVIPARRKIRFAVAGATIMLFFGAGIFLYEALSGPPPSVPPTPVPLELPAAEAGANAGTKQPVETAVPAESEAIPAPAPKRIRRPAAKPEERPRQLATGTELMPARGRSGAGKFRIVNESGQDAIARVAAQADPESALRLVYIQSGTEVNVADIGPGVYFVSFSMGPLTSKPRSFGARFGPFQFVQIQSAGGLQSDQYQVTLKPRQQ